MKDGKPVEASGAERSNKCKRKLISLKQEEEQKYQRFM
jgi:hypothetical protein